MITSYGEIAAERKEGEREMKKLNLGRLVSEIKAHWNRPPAEKHICYREFTAYSVGGIGVNTINSLFGYVALNANCLLLGSAYEIKPMDLAVMSLVMNLLNLAKTPLISMLIDNTNTKYGKFRPYLLYTGIPTAFLLIAMAFVPNSADYTLKCTLLSLIYAFLMIFQSLYALAFTSLAQVLTPNGEERTSLLSVSQFVYSLGPSVVNLFFPIFAGLLPGGMTGFTAYRILFPIFSVFGIALSFWTFKGTEEKIIVPPNYVARVRFVDGISEIKSNKYFWLMTFYNVLGALKGTIGSILAWYCIYAMQSDAMLGVMNAVIGTASVPGMLLAPLMAKKLGKRTSLIWCNLLRAGFAGLMLVTTKSPVLFLGCLYFANVSTGGDGVMVSAITADVFDFQQWKTGKRLEGFITQFSGMLVTAATMLLNLILPWFYEQCGLRNDYSVPFDESVRTPIFNVMIIVTVLSCAAAVIPILFYDMTEKKQRQIVRDLEIRARQEEASPEKAQTH